MSIARDLARHASPRYGLVARGQLIQAGLHPRAIDRAIDDGLIDAVHGGVYALVGSPSTWHRAVLAACLSAGPDAVASHRTAAAVWGLAAQPSRIEVTVPIRSHPVGDGFVLHRTRRPYAIEVRDGIPVTSVARTLADLAGTLSRSRLQEIVELGLKRQLVSVPQIVDVLDRRFRGRGRLRDVLRSLMRSDSVLETRFRGLLAQHGLPAAVPQFEIRRGGVLVARVDLVYPRERIAIELDSFAFHSSASELARDRRRKNDIRAAGFELLVFGWNDVERPTDAMGRIRRLLWERGNPDVSI